MGTTLHVFDYFTQQPKCASVNIVFGDEPLLKQLVLTDLRQRVLEDPEIPYGLYDGDTVEWRDIIDELSTVSLFGGGGTRLVVVRRADPLVTNYRSKIEKYFERPDKHGALVLEVSKWAANTRLYKLAGKTGLQIDCRAPQTGTGRNRSIDRGRVAQWLVQWAKDRHHVELTQQVAFQLVDVIGVEFGLLDQEIARLALYTEADNQITESLVQQHAGGWRAKTVWQLIDTALAGNVADALRQLDLLFKAGQEPTALMGPISWSLRRFAAATRVYQRAERQRRRVSLANALERSGFYGWQVKQGERQLRRLGRERAGQFYEQLLKIDLALKGSHSSPVMARLAIEHLLIHIAKRA